MDRVSWHHGPSVWGNPPQCGCFDCVELDLIPIKGMGFKFIFEILVYFAKPHR